MRRLHIDNFVIVGPFYRDQLALEPGPQHFRPQSSHGSPARVVLVDQLMLARNDCNVAKKSATRNAGNTSE